MFTAVMYVNNTESQTQYPSVSSAITWLSGEMDAGRGRVGEVRVGDDTIASVRRKENITIIKVYDSNFFNSGIHLDLSTAIEFQGLTVQKEGVSQSFGTNMRIGGSVKFGQVKQSGSSTQNAFTSINSDGDIDLGDLSQEV
jgi:hypothetical protein